MNKVFSVEAFIFDMDELLVESSAAWHHAEIKLFEHVGEHWTENLAESYKGMNVPDISRFIYELFNPSCSYAECKTVMRKALIEKFSEEVKPMTGAVELVNNLYGNVPLVVASGSPLEVIEFAMTSLGILDKFDFIVSSESVKNGKPNPDIFLKAAEMLKKSPENCLVFEDSLNGVKAAKSANMKCISVPSCSPEEINLLADRICNSLHDVSCDDFIF